MASRKPTLAEEQKGAALRRVREQLGLDPSEVAALLNIATESYRQYERGMNAFKPSTVAGLARAFGLPSSRLQAVLDAPGGGRLVRDASSDYLVASGPEDYFLERFGDKHGTMLLHMLTQLEAVEPSSLSPLLESIGDLIDGYLGRLARQGLPPS